MKASFQFIGEVLRNIASHQYKRTDDVIKNKFGQRSLAKEFIKVYFVLLLVFCFWLAAPYFDDSYQHSGLLSLLYDGGGVGISFAFAMVFFKGFNARSLVLFSAISISLIWAFHGYLYELAILYDWHGVRIFYYLTWCIPELIILFRVRIMLFVSRQLYRFGPLRNTAISIMTKTKYTRIDVYYSIHVMLGIAVYGLYSSVKLYYYLKNGGAWIDYDDYVTYLIAQPEFMSFHLAFFDTGEKWITVDTVMNYSWILITLYSCKREWEQPDMVYLSEREKTANTEQLASLSELGSEAIVKSKSPQYKF